MKAADLFRDLPIRQKLRRIVLIIAGISVLGACAAFMTYQWFASRNAMARQLEIVAEIVGDQSSAALEFGQAPQADAILRSLKAERQVVGAVLYGADGKVFARYLREGAEADALPARASGDLRVFDAGGLLVTVPVRSGSERIGTFSVRSDLSMASKRLMLDLVTVALVLLAAMVAVLYLSTRLGGLITQPVTRLAEVVRAVTKERKYSIRVEKGGQDEMGDLFAGFNDMLSQIEARDAALALARDELELRVQKRTRELGEANKELEGFSYSVSHDLRAPLRAISGFSQMLLEDCAPRLDAEGQRYLKVIQENTRRMGQLIDDLLAFSGLGRKNVEPVRIDMESMAKEVFEELKAANPGRTFDFRLSALPPAQGDRPMMKQVFVNLLSNAVKYSRGKEPAVIEVGSRTEAEEVVYFVRDNGVGFSMNYVEKLFGVFQRLHSPKEFEGTGVGLALVQRIIQRHGGRIWADAKLNEGAIFSFALPKKSAPVALAS